VRDLAVNGFFRNRVICAFTLRLRGLQSYSVQERPKSSPAVGKTPWIPASGTPQAVTCNLDPREDHLSSKFERNRTKLSLRNSVLSTAFRRACRSRQSIKFAYRSKFAESAALCAHETGRKQKTRINGCRCLPASRASVHVDDPENGREHAGGREVQVPPVEEVGAQDVVHG
jgi:hypothetical protein